VKGPLSITETETLVFVANRQGGRGEKGETFKRNNGPPKGRERGWDGVYQTKGKKKEKKPTGFLHIKKRGKMVLP